MTHTAHLKDKVKVKEFPKEISRGRIYFQNCFDSDITLVSVMTSEEFRKHAIEKVNKFCDKHGII